MKLSNEMQRPRVLLSVATSIDGFIDDTDDERLLLSNPADFDRVDALRAASDAVLLGAGAIRADNPRVVIRDEARQAARLAAGKDEHPLKVAISGAGNLSRDLRWFNSGGKRVVYTSTAGAPVLADAVGDRADVVDLGSEVSFDAVLADLGRRGVSDLMVEGGQQVHTGLMEAGLVDEISLAVAPLLVGDGPRFVGTGRFPWPSRKRWELQGTETVGDVVVLRYRIDQAYGPPGEETDRAWLERAIDLAERCPPSPTAFSVGAVIVDESGNELAAGYSRETDRHVHAEESALAKIDDRIDLSTATIYSSLEPCAERASRPTPCANLIIDRGLGRVVLAWTEPDDYVERPDGVATLRAAGVEVVQLPVDRPPNYRN